MKLLRNKSNPADRYALAELFVESVEKVGERCLVGNAQKNDCVKCTSRDDHTIRRGKKIPENSTKIVWHSYSTGSLEATGYNNA